MAKKDKKGERSMGERAVAAAARYLELKGYEILDRGWSCPDGEADIVALDGDCVVFAEASAHTGVGRGFPPEETTEERRSRFERIAAWWLCDHEYVDVPVRFDAISLLVLDADRAMLRHATNVFGCPAF